ncbi:siderophore-interacting protein [Chelativorans sp. AA-79]|uniref:siderophore-interacting protein n=1 Tax=Chelativorans sp. AA-79 TaxID=3028735 RepID=UPI0023F87CF6|nr:siderophore-interacting protein [Chelativorans sp. AA-79]WEX08292.1 siderophore-interacting protein [Chelativorans sp. AA-79]
MNTIRLLSAETFVPLSAPTVLMSHLREHFDEHGRVSGSEHAWSASFDIGSATASLREDGIAFRVEAGDDTSLSFLQWSVAEHVYQFVPDEKPPIVWRGGTAPGAPLPYFRAMRVVRAAQVTPLMRRLTLAGENLARFARDGLHVRLLLPPKPGVVPVWPVMGADGRQAWPEGERPAVRIYTIRRIDVEAGEIDIDFVLHEGDDMPGARFGMEASPGEVVGMIGPGGGNLAQASRYIFAGDETALPAISRMLEELPPHAQAKAFIEVASTEEEQELTHRPGIEVNWLSRQGRPTGSTTLLIDALRGLDRAEWEGDSYLWAGCEHEGARSIREFLKAELDFPKRRSLVAVYWRRGRAGEESRN